jgi:hypothetical protein
LGLILIALLLEKSLLLFPHRIKLFFNLPGCFDHRQHKFKKEPVSKVDGHADKEVAEHCAKINKIGIIR